MRLRPSPILAAAVLLTLAGCGDKSSLPVGAGVGPDADPAAAEENADPDGRHRAGQGLERRQAERRPRASK